MVVPGRLELPTSTLSVWRSNQLSYRTVSRTEGEPRPSLVSSLVFPCRDTRQYSSKKHGQTPENRCHAKDRYQNATHTPLIKTWCADGQTSLQKGGVPAAPSGTATLLRLSPNHRFHPRPTLAVTDFRRPRLSWLDGRCVQGPGTYSPRHG